MRPLATSSVTSCCVSHFTESWSHPDVDRIRKHIFDPQKEDLLSIPVSSGLPVEEQIMNVNISMFVRKLVALVKTKCLH